MKSLFPLTHTNTFITSHKHKYVKSILYLIYYNPQKSSACVLRSTDAGVLWFGWCPYEPHLPCAELPRGDWYTEWHGCADPEGSHRDCAHSRQSTEQKKRWIEKTMFPMLLLRIDKQAHHALGSMPMLEHAEREIYVVVNSLFLFLFSSDTWLVSDINKILFISILDSLSL